MSKLLSIVCLGFLFITFSHAHTPKGKYVFVASNFKGIVELVDGKPTGLGVELLANLADALNFTTSIHIVPWKRALLMVKNGQADGLIGAYHSASRAEYLSYTTVPIYQDDMLFFTRKGVDFNWQGNYQSLNNYVFGLIRGGAYGAKFDAIRSELNIIELGSAEQQFKMLIKGRVDVIANNSRTSPSLINKLNISHDITMHYPSLASRKGYFALAKQSKIIHLLPQINQLMIEYENNNSLKKLRNTYLVPLNKTAVDTY